MSEKLTECPNCKTPISPDLLDLKNGWIECYRCYRRIPLPEVHLVTIDKSKEDTQGKKETPRFEVKTLNTNLEGEFVDHLQELLNSGYELKSSYTGVFEGANCAEHVWKALLVKDNHKTDQP